MIPYAPRERFTQPNRLSDLILRSGDAQADAHLRSGQIWGNTIGKLGNIASGYVEDRAAQKQEQAQADALTVKEQAFFKHVEENGGKPDPKFLMRWGGPTAGPKLVQTAIELERAELGLSQDIEKSIATIAEGWGELSPNIQKAVWASKLRPLAIKSGQFGGEQDLPAELTPEISEAIKSRAPNKAQKLEKIEVRNPDGSTSIEFVEPKAGLKFTNAPEPPKPEQPRVVGRSLVGPDGKVIYRDPESKTDRVENKMWVMRPGADGKMKSIFIPESQVQEGDQPANTRSGEGRPSLGGEKSALGFFNRAKQADEELKNLEPIIQKMGIMDQGRLKYAHNALQSPEGKLYSQAQRAFTEARLRKDSGAAIPETEFENDRVTYFVQPGDDEATIQQKARGRAAVLASLAFQSGRALNEFYGDEAEPLIEGYKARQTGKSDAANAAAAPTGSPKPSKGRLVQVNGIWKRVP